MPYPEFRAGQRVTALLLNKGRPEYIYNAAPQTNATTTPADITDLGFWGEAGGVYDVKARVAYDAPTATDAVFRWFVPGDGVMQRNIIAQTAGTTTNIDSNMIAIRRGGTTAQIVGAPNGVASAFSVYLEDSILRMGGTAGWVPLQVNANAAGTVTVQGDSYLIVTQVGGL
ncbi:hypothetical protein [Actinocorallia longicatena]|uniref:Uncharacterized protein n=1 Tax=Actinocorallia longicatena TaxID=111803 RepID=A0ABP6QEK4_9ACTN